MTLNVDVAIAFAEVLLCCTPPIADDGYTNPRFMAAFHILGYRRTQADNVEFLGSLRRDASLYRKAAKKSNSQWYYDYCRVFQEAVALVLDVPAPRKEKAKC